MDSNPSRLWRLVLVSPSSLGRCTTSWTTNIKQSKRCTSNNFLILRAPRPPIISTKSEPAFAINGTPASFATALARSVFPTPGGPVSKHPRGILAPSRSYSSGFCLQQVRRALTKDVKKWMTGHGIESVRFTS